MPDWLVPVIIALIGSKLAEKLVDILHRQFTGREGRRRTEITKLQTALDDEMKRRRRAVEALHETRIAAIRHGVAVTDLPPWPGGTGSTPTQETP